MVRCAITSGKAGVSVAETLFPRCAELSRDGVDLVLVREKHLAAGALAALVRGVIEAVRGSRMRVLVAGRADVALAAGAHGVHLSARAGELTPEQVRRVFPGAAVSVSCHTAAEVVRARDADADWVLFGPVFGKSVDGLEVVPGTGVETLRDACQAAGDMPVLALGGLTEWNVTACELVGAAGFAGIRYFFPES